MPPVIFPPQLVITVPPWLETTVNGELLRGSWFTNGDAFHTVLTPRLPAEVLRDPRSPALNRLVTSDGQSTSSQSDCSLTQTLYATPLYWNRLTQTGPEQWIVQRLGKIQFPSQKGLARQNRAYNVPGHPNGFFACCTDFVHTSVLWADLSATTEVQGRLKVGEPSFFSHGQLTPRPLWSSGIPIDGTLHGVLGVDR